MGSAPTWDPAAEAVGAGPRCPGEMRTPLLLLPTWPPCRPMLEVGPHLFWWEVRGGEASLARSAVGVAHPPFPVSSSAFPDVVLSLQLDRSPPVPVAPHGVLLSGASAAEAERSRARLRSGVWVSGLSISLARLAPAAWTLLPRLLSGR